MTTHMGMRVASDNDGARLDKVLEDLFPELGLRGRRRLVKDGRVLVDGRPRSAAYKVRAGQSLSIAARAVAAIRDDVFVVRELNGLAAVFKPSGLHTAALAGRANPSLERMLPRLFPETEARLLNRLDEPTSGLVMVALTDQAEASYQTLESEGRIRKEYSAIVAGGLDGPVVVKNALDTANRTVTRVLDQDDPDSTRWTEVEPVRFLPAGRASLVRAVIRRGARHQIRAHLASLGHPIHGDDIYGGPVEDRLYLHHCSIVLDGFEAGIAPDWNDESS